MKNCALKLWFVCCFVLCGGAFAQEPGMRAERLGGQSDRADLRSIETSTEAADASESISVAALPRLIKFSNTVGTKDLSGKVSITFSLYADQQGGSPLWSETQMLDVKSGKFTALLGASSAVGLPLELFSTDQARWLAVQITGQPEQARSLLVSVPYAMKALEADRISGKQATDFVSADQLDQAVKAAIANAQSTTTSGKIRTREATSSGSAALPATDYTDNNGSEVLLVTQNGSGRAITAYSAGGTAIYAETPNASSFAIYGKATNPTGATAAVVGENVSQNGVGLQGLASSPTGLTIGLLGQSNSVTGRGLRGLAPSTTGGTVGVQGEVYSGSGIGVQGDSFATTGLTYGVRGVTVSNQGRALAGLAQATTGDTVAIDGNNGSDQGTAIFAYESSASGTTFGLKTRIDSPDGTAARFESTSTSTNATLISAISGGVQKFRVDAAGHMISTNYNANDNAVEGHAVSTLVDPINGNYAVGVFGTSDAPQGNGVNGVSTNEPGDGAAGVIGISQGSKAVAVWGEAQDPSNLNGPNVGVFGETSSSNGFAGAFNNINTSGKIVDFRSNGTSVAFVDANGFHGDGTNLTGIASTSGLSAETAARIAGDAALTTSLAAANTNIATNAADIATANTNLANETAARVAADNTLTSGLAAANGIIATNTANISSNTTAIASNATAITNETNARTAADTTLTNNLATANTNIAANTVAITAEAATRLSGDSANATAITNETAARTAADSLAAKLGSANAFTSGNTFTGALDASGASSTLPVKTTTIAGTPGACLANKELLIKSDAPAGQQLFICNGTNNGWNLVGDGASGGVVSFNGRVGAVTPAASDYSFAQLSGTASVAQGGTGATTASGARTALGAAASGANSDITSLSGLTTALSVAQGGTGSTTQNFVDLTTTQTIAGAKTFSSTIAGSVSGNAGTATLAANSSALNGKADTAFEQVANKNAVSGYAGLDATLRVAKAQAPVTTVFTDAANTFTAGAQNFTAAANTLPVKSVTIATTPGACTANKELIIKTDAAAGQQLFICNSTNNGWNLVGDGASGGVTSFNGRVGVVTPSASDYSFAQLSGTALVAQGGTGATTASGARTALSAAASGANSDVTSLSGLTTALSAAQGGTGVTSSGASGSYLRSNGTVWASSTIQLSDLPSLSGSYVDLASAQNIAGTKTFSSTITGDISGNAGSVTNGVYTTGAQTIAGAKSFSSTITGDISGNAGTVTNGVYTAGNQSIAGIKTFTGTVDASTAAATLPVRTSSTFPGTCTANAELLIKTGSITAGQQLFLCNSAGTGWNLIGDGLGNNNNLSFNPVTIVANSVNLVKNACTVTYTGVYPAFVTGQDIPIPPASGSLSSTSTLVASVLSSAANSMPSAWDSYTFMPYVDSSGTKSFLHVCNLTLTSYSTSGAITFNVRAIN